MKSVNPSREYDQRKRTWHAFLKPVARVLRKVKQAVLADNKPVKGRSGMMLHLTKAQHHNRRRARKLQKHARRVQRHFNARSGYRMRVSSPA